MSIKIDGMDGNGVVNTLFQYEGTVNQLTQVLGNKPLTNNMQSGNQDEPVANI